MTRQSLKKMWTPTPFDDEIFGTAKGETILALDGDDLVVAQGGDDLVFGGRGDDDLRGGTGFDVLFGEHGNDRIFGGANSDFVYGGEGNDRLFGDGGIAIVAGTDLAGDRLDGGDGDDVLFAGDGLDTLTLGDGMDTVRFSFNNPTTPLAVMTGPAFAAITDVNPDEDTLSFDTVGVGLDHVSANFVNNGDPVTGGAVQSFFSGAVADTAGEDVMILTDQAFATGALAVQTANGEEFGDLIVYFNSTVGVGSLLHVTGTDTAVSIARFTNFASVDDLAAANFTASDFIFV